VDTRRLVKDHILYTVSSNVKSFELVCDATQLNRVMVNLLQNAEEALEEINGQKKIIIQIMLDGDFVSISVLDNGPGFSEQVLENAIKAYFTTKTKGTGLGLAIVDRIIQDHFGSFSIFNREEGGGCIKLIFNTRELRIKVKQTF
jgi:two-component system nitrogen regulation sensor histidine kinase NtrY